MSLICKMKTLILVAICSLALMAHTAHSCNGYDYAERHNSMSNLTHCMYHASGVDEHETCEKAYGE